MEYIPVFYDTETTGVRPGKDVIIEIAAYAPSKAESFSSLVNPEFPIPPEATAISGINDEMVKNAPKIQEALEKFTAYCGPNALLIAHNNDAFDKLFLKFEFQRANLSMPEWRFFDTLKWSRKYRNDLPRHSLQFLRETYGIASNQAHRAMDDVYVLHQVFTKMTDDLPWRTILELVEQKSQITRMPFGKYAGKPLSDLPRDYILWLKGSGALDKKENALLKEALELVVEKQ